MRSHCLHHWFYHLVADSRCRPSPVELEYVGSVLRGSEDGRHLLQYVPLPVSATLTMSAKASSVSSFLARTSLLDVDETCTFIDTVLTHRWTCSRLSIVSTDAYSLSMGITVHQTKHVAQITLEQCLRCRRACQTCSVVRGPSPAAATEAWSSANPDLSMKP